MPKDESSKIEPPISMSMYMRFKIIMKQKKVSYQNKTYKLQKIDHKTNSKYEQFERLIQNFKNMEGHGLSKQIVIPSNSSSEALMKDKRSVSVAGSCNLTATVEILNKTADQKSGNLTKLQNPKL